jgi:guanylate kinase
MSDIKTERCILLGKSGSGKDFLLRGLVAKGLKPCLKMTTRPQRKNEVQGQTYNFTEKEAFLKLITEDKFICHQTFEVTPEGKTPETWYYGITKEEFENSQVVIMTPGEFSNITTEQRKGLFVVYLDITREVREYRLKSREDKNDSIKRRMDADDLDFAKFTDYDLRITDPEFLAEDVYDLMD